VAQAVLRSHKGMALVATCADSSTRHIKVPVAVLAAHSAMVHSMVQDEVLRTDVGEADGSDAGTQVLPANPRDSASAVGCAMRWAMGMRTCLMCSVEELAAVFRCAGGLLRPRALSRALHVTLFTACSVADHFQMPALRMEALSVLCSKARVSDWPLLDNLVHVHNVDELKPCLLQLRKDKLRAEAEAHVLGGLQLAK